MWRTGVNRNFKAPSRFSMKNAHAKGWGLYSEFHSLISSFQVQLSLIRPAAVLSLSDGPWYSRPGMDQVGHHGFHHHHCFLSYSCFCSCESDIPPHQGAGDYMLENRALSRVSVLQCLGPFSAAEKCVETFIEERRDTMRVPIPDMASRVCLQS